jgi:hypothetical protein
VQRFTPNRRRVWAVAAIAAAAALLLGGNLAWAGQHDAGPVAATPVRGDAAAPPGQAAPADLPYDIELLNKNKRPERFWRGADCQLYHKWLRADGTWSGVASLGGCLLNSGLWSIDGAGNDDGRLEMFGIGTNHEMFHIWQLSPGGSWSGWSSLGGNLVSEPYTGGLAGGGIYVDALGPDNIWHRRHQTAPNCCWSGWVFGDPH